MATQTALALMNGSATKVPMMAKTAKIAETTNTAVVGAERFMSNPPSLFDARTVIVFS
jgi:hypothetical protein